MEHQIELTAEGLWSEVSGRLRGALNETTYRTWFGEVAGLELDGETFVLAVPNDFTRDWIEGHFRGLIGAAVRDIPARSGRSSCASRRPSSCRALPLEPSTTAPVAQRIRADPRAAASTRSTPSTPS